MFPVRVPPLRERPEDIALLVRHFVEQFSRRNGRNIESIPSETMEALVRYHWPGNIRELQNIIERAVIISKGSVLNVSLADLKSPAADAAPLQREVVRATQQASTHDLRSDMEQAERGRILSALEQANWIVAGPHGAAARLGIKRTTLQARMRKLGISITRTGHA
ncbi:MAG: helix-turn-helix domain-containing protein [Acidobacteriota bacterium]